MRRLRFSQVPILRNRRLQFAVVASFLFIFFYMRPSGDQTLEIVTDVAKQLYNGTILPYDVPFSVDRYPEWAKNSVDLGFVLPVYIWDAVLWNNSKSIAFLAPTATRKWVDRHPKPKITFPESYFKMKCIFGDSASYTDISVIPDEHHNIWILSCDLSAQEQALLQQNQQVRVSLLDLNLGVQSKNYMVKSFAKTEKQHKITACTMIMNEEKYIAEWIEYMQLMKVTKFYFYDNGSTDKTLKVLQPYVDQGLVTVVDWSMYPYKNSKFNSQIMAFNDCVYRFKDYSEFQLQFDVDEYPFSMSEDIQDLDQLIEKYKDEEPEFGQLLLTFMYFGTNEWDGSKLVTEAYWRALHWPGHPGNALGYHRKPILWLQNLKAVSIHTLTTGGHSVYVNGENEMRINHYWHGSRGAAKNLNEKYDDSMKDFLETLKQRLGRE